MIREYAGSVSKRKNAEALIGHRGVDRHLDHSGQPVDGVLVPMPPDNVAVSLELAERS